MMKPICLASSLLAASLAIATPSLVLAHVGHGDEFQSEGDINRVQVDPETDPILGIQVTPIAPAADGSTAVLVPVTALVDADGKQIAFVQYENFYEPVPVTIGTTQGDLIEVTEGLSVGEQLVTQGSLSLYAESRKTQTADAETASPEAAAPQTTVTQPDVTQPNVTHAQADAQGIPHGHDAEGNLVQSETIAQQPSETAQSSKGFPMATLAAVGGGAVLLVGAITLLSRDHKKKSTLSDKDGGF